MVDHLGEGPQSHAGVDGAPPLGEQGPHLTDGPGNGGAVNAKPAGQNVVGGPVAEMDEGGQEPSMKPVFRSGSDLPLPRPGDKPRLVPFMPQRAHLGDEFSDLIGQEVRDLAVADECCACRIPYHTTMINDQALTGSPAHRQPCTSSSGD